MIRFENLTRSYQTNAGLKTVLRGSNALFETGGNYAIMGPNGAGKSTVMRLISGADIPTSGRVVSDELVSWPLGFHGGFNASMTGRENVIFVARIYGQNEDDIIESAAEFAEIGRALDEPVSSYSSGMKQRLAFGLSLAIDFGTYLIDETIAVGDARFRKKCELRLRQKLGVARVIMISHSIKTVESYCQRGLLLWQGSLYEYDDIKDLIADYNRLC